MADFNGSEIMRKSDVVLGWAAPVLGLFESTSQLLPQHFSLLQYKLLHQQRSRVIQALPQ